MCDFIAMIRDTSGSGVRIDRIDGWESRSAHGRTRIYTAGGGIVDLRILPDEFVKRLDQALTEMAERHAE